MRAYQNLQRFKRNVDVLGRHTLSMRAFQLPARFGSRLVLLDNNQFNIDIGNGSLLYPEDSVAAAARQVEDYLAQPLRFRVPRCKGTEDSHAALDDFYGCMDERLSAFPPRAQAQAFGGFVVVFGLGLGHHIDLLISKLRFKTLIIVEPIAEFLLHSLHVVDWEKIVSKLKRDGREVFFVSGQDTVKTVQSVLSGRNFACADNSYIYQHYRSDDFDALSKWLMLGTGLGIESGWYEDQVTAIRNNLANFSVPGCRLLKAPLGKARTPPALVVGAGPSLDAQIETIRALRDKAVIITASSALRVLLEQGIRPDIHCEVENTEGLGDVAESLSARHGLKDITLFAASTVNPRIAPCFRETVYYFRPGIGATYLLGQEANTTDFAMPTSGNAAVY